MKLSATSDTAATNGLTLRKNIYQKFSYRAQIVKRHHQLHWSVIIAIKLFSFLPVTLFRVHFALTVIEEQIMAEYGVAFHDRQISGMFLEKLCK